MSNVDRTFRNLT